MRDEWEFTRGGRVGLTGQNLMVMWTYVVDEWIRSTIQCMYQGADRASYRVCATPSGIENKYQLLMLTESVYIKYKLHLECLIVQDHEVRYREIRVFLIPPKT